MDPIVLACITGLTTSGLSCLAVQGGLLASSIAAAESSEAPITAAVQPTTQLVASVTPQPTTQPAPQVAVPTVKPAAESQLPAKNTGAAPLANAVGPAVSASNVVTIAVGNIGYAPATSHAKPSQPPKLALVTNKTVSCARAFVIPSLKIEEVLPQTGTVMVDIPPAAGQQAVL